MAFHHHKKIAALDATFIEKAVLRALSDFADNKGLCWPSQATLASVAGVSDRSVRRAVKSLVEKGYLRVTHTKTSNRYVLSFPHGQGVLPVGTVCPIQVDTVSYKYTNESTNEYTKNKKTLLTQKGIKEKPGNTQEDIVKKDKYPEGMTSSVALSLISSKASAPKVNKKCTPAQIEYYWKETLPLIYTDLTMISKFTVKELGLAKQFIQGVGEDNALAILDAVLHNWIEYISDVKSSAGLSVAPTMPNLLFLVKYRHQAADFKIKADHLKAGYFPKVTLMSKPVEAPVVVPVEVDEEDEVVQDAAFFDAILKEYSK